MRVYVKGCIRFMGSKMKRDVESSKLKDCALHVPADLARLMLGIGLRFFVARATRLRIGATWL